MAYATRERAAFRPAPALVAFSRWGGHGRRCSSGTRSRIRTGGRFSWGWGGAGRLPGLAFGPRLLPRRERRARLPQGRFLLVQRGGVEGQPDRLALPPGAHRQLDARDRAGDRPVAPPRVAVPTEPALARHLQPDQGPAVPGDLADQPADEELRPRREGGPGQGGGVQVHPARGRLELRGGGRPRWLGSRWWRRGWRRRLRRCGWRRLRRGGRLDHPEPGPERGGRISFGLVFGRCHQGFSFRAGGGPNRSMASYLVIASLKIDSQDGLTSQTRLRFPARFDLLYARAPGAIKTRGARDG